MSDLPTAASWKLNRVVSEWKCEAKELKYSRYTLGNGCLPSALWGMKEPPPPHLERKDSIKGHASFWAGFLMDVIQL